MVVVTETSFRAIFAGLQRRLKGVNRVDIIFSKEFISSNEVFQARCVYLKK